MGTAGLIIHGRGKGYTSRCVSVVRDDVDRGRSGDDQNLAQETIVVDLLRACIIHQCLSNRVDLASMRRVTSISVAI